MSKADLINKDRRAKALCKHEPNDWSRKFNPLTA